MTFISILYFCILALGVPGGENLLGDLKNKSEGFNIINALPVNYVKDASMDYTAEIQSAVRKHNNIIFPGFPLLINDAGIKLMSNQTVTFLPGSVLRLKASKKTHYAILDITAVQNVTVNNPVIIGDRYTHLDHRGEWGMGIRISASSNIKIFGGKISNCWGDGIYIGQQNFVNSSDITIKNVKLTKNRRDGISIIAVDGLLMENVYAAYQDGTKPMCGINFESNNPFCEIKKVLLINPRTEFNSGSGIQIALSTMLGADEKKVDVKIVNHIDIGSKSFAFKLASNRKDSAVTGSIKGSVTIIKPSWNRTIGDRPLAFVTDQKNLKLTIISPQVRKYNGSQLVFSEIKTIFDKHSNGDLTIL